MKYNYLLLIFLPFFFACNNGGKEDGSMSYVIDCSRPVSSIKISDSKGNSAAEYSFAYDENNRLTSFKSTAGSSDVTLQLALAYSGSADLSISGSYKLSVSSDDTDGTMTITGTNGTQKYNYNGKSLSSIVQEIESQNSKGTINNSFTSSYVYSSGNLTKMSFSNKSSDNRQLGATFNVDGAFERKVEYTNKPDKQNFSALALSDNYVLWYVKGFPGNAMLPESITTDNQNAGITKSEFEYTLNADGFIESAVRTDYNKSKLVQKLYYKFTY